MSWVFNPFTGNLDYYEKSTGPGPVTPGAYNIQRFTLSSTDITNKYVLLPQAPTTDSKTLMFIIGASSTEDYGVDFQMTADNAGRRLSWDGKGLDGLLSSGDKLTIMFD